MNNNLWDKIILWLAIWIFLPVIAIFMLLQVLFVEIPLQRKLAKKYRGVILFDTIDNNGRLIKRAFKKNSEIAEIE